MKSFSEAEKETIKAEIKDRFNQLVYAINRLDAGAGSREECREQE